MDELKKLDHAILIRKKIMEAVEQGHSIAEVQKVSEKLNVSVWQIFNACMAGGVPVYTRSSDGVLLCDFTALVNVLKTEAEQNNIFDEERIERRG